MYRRRQRLRSYHAIVGLGVFVSVIETSSSFLTLPEKAIASVTSSPREYRPSRCRCQLTRDEAESMTVPALKDFLRGRGLKVGGKKAELVDRVLGCFGSAESLADELKELCGPLETESNESGITVLEKNDEDISWRGEDIPSYREYVEQLQAMSFLSSIFD